MKCWQFFDANFRVKQFTMNINLLSNKTKKWIKFEQVLIDTGFDGDILIPYDEFEKLGFKETLLRESEKFIAESVTGEEILLQSALSEIRINDIKIPIMVETFFGNNETMIGRGMLINLKIMIDGPEEQVCLV